MTWCTYPRNETLVHKQAWESGGKWENNELVSMFASLVPRPGGGGERVPGTHCLRMRLITTNFRGNRVRMCTYVYSWCHKLAALCQFMCSCVLLEWVLYRAVLCLLVAGYLKIMLKKEQVTSIECIYRGDMPLCSYPPILVSPFLPRPPRHFSL